MSVWVCLSLSLSLSLPLCVCVCVCVCVCPLPLSIPKAECVDWDMVSGSCRDGVKSLGYLAAPDRVNVDILPTEDLYAWFVKAMAGLEASAMNTNTLNATAAQRERAAQRKAIFFANAGTLKQVNARLPSAWQHDVINAQLDCAVTTTAAAAAAAAAGATTTTTCLVAGFAPSAEDMAGTSRVRQRSLFEWAAGLLGSSTASTGAVNYAETVDFTSSQVLAIVEGAGGRCTMAVAWQERERASASHVPPVQQVSLGGIGIARCVASVALVHSTLCFTVHCLHAWFRLCTHTSFRFCSCHNMRTC